MTTTPETPRARYLRLRWRSILAAAGAPSANPTPPRIALFGAGRHTRWILESLRLHNETPHPITILDDDPSAGTRTIATVPVTHAPQADPGAFAAVIVSSDSIEPQLARRAAQWAARATSPPPVFRLYEGIPQQSGPFTTEHDDLFTQLADALESDPQADTAALIESRSGEHTSIRTLPRPPESHPPAPRPPNSPPAQLPVPPKGRRSGYDADEAHYLAAGRRVAESILTSVRAAIAPDWTPRRVLEWGCSSARVLRHMPALVPEAECWGCDIDAWSIDWAAAHLAPPLRLFRSTTAPSLPLESNAFDLVYAVSVFTHMSDHVDTCLMELRRILRPGGVLFASINDEHVWSLCAADPDHYITRLCPRLDFTKPLDHDFIAQGTGPNAQSFWHTDAVRRRWSFAFEALAFTPGLIDAVQTGVVLRKRD